jgi:peptidoglycan/LPS O-acetylase OafA/YrhL
MTTAHPASDKGSATKKSLSIDQVTYLNIIRALAAELVLVDHGFLYFYKDVNTYISLGSIGVVAFFLASGFLISRSVFTNVGRGNYNIWDYLIERFARIYTAYIPALALIATIDYFLIYYPSFPDAENYNLWNAIGSIFMLHGLPVLQTLYLAGCNSCWLFKDFSSAHTVWTLPIEWWIYVTFGLVFFSMKERSWTVLRLAILALVSLYPLYHFIARFSGNLTGVWMMGLGASALYYWMEISQVNKPENNRWILLTALILTVLTIPMGAARLVYSNFYVFDTTFTMLLAVLLCAPVFVLKLHPIRVPNIIRSLAHHTASYSYSLYLIHTTFMIAILTVHREWISQPIDLIVMLGVINVIAFCFAHLFELRYPMVAERLKALFQLRKIARQSEQEIQLVSTGKEASSGVSRLNYSATMIGRLRAMAGK